jgi:hypothetical protein
VGVWLFQRVDFVGRELNVQCRDCLGKVVLPGRSDDRGGDDRVGQNPRQRDLGHGRAAGLGNPLDRTDDGFVERRVEGPDDLVDGGAQALLAPRAREAAFPLRGVRHQAHAHVSTHRDQLRLVMAAPMVSSTGVSGSKGWIWYRST